MLADYIWMLYFLILKMNKIEIKCSHSQMWKRSIPKIFKATLLSLRISSLEIHGGGANSFVFCFNANSTGWLDAFDGGRIEFGTRLNFLHQQRYSVAISKETTCKVGSEGWVDKERGEWSGMGVGFHPFVSKRMQIAKTFAGTAVRSPKLLIRNQELAAVVTLKTRGNWSARPVTWRREEERKENSTSTSPLFDCV